MPARRRARISRSTANTSTRRTKGVVGIPFFDEYVEKAALDYLDRNGKSGQPFFMSVNFMKVHQPNMPAPEFQHKSLSKSQVCRLGRRERHAHRPHHGQGARARPRQEHLCFLDHRQRRLAGRLSGCRLHAVPRHEGHRPRGRSRVPSIAWGPGIKAGSKNSEIVGGLDYMATFAALGGREAAGERPRRKADHLRQLRYDAGAVRHRQIAAQFVVLLHRERADAGRGAGRQLQGRVQSARRQRREDRRPRGRLEPRLEGAGEVCRDRAPGVRPMAGPAGTLRHIHEQLSPSIPGCWSR